MREATDDAHTVWGKHGRPNTSIIEKKGTIIKPDDKTMNEQVGMNGEEGEGKSDNKKKGVPE